MRISVLGCGWLGFPLGLSLAENGFSIKGSTTTPSKLGDLKSKGISPFLINVNKAETLAQNPDFFDCDILFLNIPPRSRKPELAPLFPNKVKLILEHLQAKTKIIFASTTGVYQDLNCPVDEHSLLKKDHPVIQAEKLIKQSDFDATILRLAGLIGGERHPAKQLAGRTLSNGDAIANLVHRKDCIQVIQAIIRQGKWGKVYNVCANKHPTRKEIYTTKALALGLEAPQFEAPHLKAYKIVRNDFLKRDLDYEFLMPDPMEF